MDSQRPESGPEGAPPGRWAPGTPERTDGAALQRALAEAIDASDPREVPARLCRACVDNLDITGASVSLSGGSGLRALWWSSDTVAGQLAEAQYTLGDGPCQSALSLVAPVLANDLGSGPDAERWPVFAQRAVELGVRAVFSLPLGSEALAIGTLDLYRSRPGPLSARDMSFAFPAGDAITFALLRLQADDASGADERAASWLGAAEEEHQEVYYATGMIMMRFQEGSSYALARLRAYAFAEGRTVTEVARDVIARRVTLDE
ncbi:GAF and ANTAR domain-containing protein [Streptomyces sp. CA-256286]|uniref:GAF and ANTAR domain-containing protein n=1 Tax=Streptomyces sp. CA-256286 TaxID=2801033 RepID=UPI001A98DA33|nr:GAF and ANTAR domain-containing protein [Streptomyces sp. CA-256286]QTA36683.1 ANTAR domain-containing protein [Streptomyces sp. CA-256286]